MSLLRRSAAIAFAAALFVGTGSAIAQDVDVDVDADNDDRSGLYLGATGGVTFPDSVDIDDDVAIDDEVDLEDGWSAGGSIGMYLGAFRIEAEGSYRENDFDDESILFSGGEFSSTSAMANVFWDIPVFERTEIYVGGGLGWAWTDIQVETAIGPDFDDSDDTWAWQVMVGVTYQVTDDLHLGVGYRLWSTDDLEIGDVDVEAPFVHTAELVLRYDI